MIAGNSEDATGVKRTGDYLDGTQPVKTGRIYDTNTSQGKDKIQYFVDTRTNKKICRGVQPA